jgi:tetrahydromethanopterin S-methyltransferase subunit A
MPLELERSLQMNISKKRLDAIITLASEPNISALEITANIAIIGAPRTTIEKIIRHAVRCGDANAAIVAVTRRNPPKLTGNEITRLVRKAIDDEDGDYAQKIAKKLRPSGELTIAERIRLAPS